MYIYLICMDTPFQIRIEAYDQGLPTSLSTDLDLIIYVRNVNDYEPQFIVNEISVNFTEHADPGSERIKLPDTIDQDEMDLDDPDTAPHQVCYFILQGNEAGYFRLDPETHVLIVERELDRELTANFTLYVKATEKCNGETLLSHEFEQLEDDSRSFTAELTGHSTQLDSTIVCVRVRVLDINDNPPHFRSKIFTGGITTNADFGLRFMRVEAVDPDEGANAKISYHQVGEIRQTLSEGLENLRKAPFLIDSETGEVQLNFDPQKGMKGYFDFMVLANDSLGMRDVAHVFIYLLREDQKVRFVFRLQPDELRARIDSFRE